MDTTILRLPNMQVVLNRGSSEEDDPMEEVVVRRSSRRRLNSAEHERGEERELERRRKEPAHRRKNRQRVKQQQKNGKSAPTEETIDEEEVEGLQRESGMERKMIEELLKKYGFGSWVKPEEETTEEYSGYSANTRLANDIPSTN